MQHRLALVGELLIGAIELVHNVHQRATRLITLAHTLLERVSLQQQPSVLLKQIFQVKHDAVEVCSPNRTRTIRVQDHVPRPFSALRFSRSLRILSISFSRAIILSSRPITTSSNFSRSRIFSCSSALDSCKSRTTCS